MKVEVSKQCLCPRCHGNCIQKDSEELEVKGKTAMSVDLLFSESLILKNVTGREVCGSGVCLGLHYNDLQESILSSKNIFLNI